VAERLALLIATDTHQDADLPASPHAEADAAALSRALEALGFAKENQILLTGSGATRTAVASRLRKLLKSPPALEALFVFFAGHAFRDGSEDYLACFDTQADDLAETSVSLRSLLDALAACSTQRLAVFLDVRSAAGDQPLAHKSLATFFAKRPGASCFVAAGEAEESHASGTLKSGIWAHHLIEALTGKAPLAVEDDEKLTVASLQEHLAREVPRTLRTTFREAPAQTPGLYAPAARFVLADLGKLLEGEPPPDPRLQPLHRASLRAEATAKVKSLAGYRKFHKLPDRVNASSRKFVSDLAADDVKSDVDQVYATVRELLGYKRRDVESSTDRGTGVVRTPDFEYSVSVDMSDDDPTTIVWRREISGIRNPAVILGKAFQQVFGGTFDVLAFEFVRPFDLESWVDRIEEEMPAGVKLRCAADCSTCDVVVAGFAGVIRLSPHRVEVQGQAKPGSGGLVEAFLRFQDLFAGRDLDQLPLLEDKSE
jgi:hypothetical protein